MTTRSSSPSAARTPTRTASTETLSEGSTVVVPLSPAAWAPLYGRFKDPYGVGWVLDVAIEYNPA